MSRGTQWLCDLDEDTVTGAVDGLLRVEGYVAKGRLPEEVAIMEKAKAYGAHFVFFEASHDGRPSAAQAFIYVHDRVDGEPQFAQLHKRLWSWGGVPLIYRKSFGLVQLFRCAHRADFEHNGTITFSPFRVLDLASQIAADPWWDSERLHNGTLWDDPSVCEKLLSSSEAAQKTLIAAVKELHTELTDRSVLPKGLRRRLLILSILIAYLEARGVFEEDFFGRFKRGATRFFEVLADGAALLKLLDHLEDRFNGHVFTLADQERTTLHNSHQLSRFASLVEGREEPGGQRTLWQRYSFADLPVELISHIYQLFVKDTSVEVYTPHFVVRLMLGEILSWDRLDRLEQQDEVILDGCCGSGIFLVEAYKRLVLHWRYRNEWRRPPRTVLTALLTKRVRGIDVEEGAVELAAFSLCLALCDALEPKEIRTSIKLFPLLKEQTIHTSCFFEAKEQGVLRKRVGVIVGNPPFTSKLSTTGAQRAYDRYGQQYGALPDKQLAYLFLHESMEMLAPGGVLAMLQQYNFLYNQYSQPFRQRFFERWDIREILDFISVRGLFQKGGADTKVVVVIAEAQSAPLGRQILHATFRRSGRTDAEQGFDLDYYDMHWLPRESVRNDGVWRSNLLGGGRVLAFADRLRKYRTLAQLATESGWEVGEGWIVGNPKDARPSAHVVGKKYVEASALNDSELDPSAFDRVPDQPLQWPRRAEIYTPPLLLIHKHADLRFGTWTRSYLTYRHTIVGISASTANGAGLVKAGNWLKSHKRVLQAFLALSGTAALASKATAVLSDDVLQLPFPNGWTLDLTEHERVLVNDIVDYYRDLIRLGADSAAMKEPGRVALPAFNDAFTDRINAVYTEKKVRALEPQAWPGLICQPYVFGAGEINWSGTEELRGKLDALLRERRGAGLQVTRIARIYDGACIYLLKPDRLRYWLPSVALRDSDEVLADLMEQGF